MAVESSCRRSCARDVTCRVAVLASGIGFVAAVSFACTEGGAANAAMIGGLQKGIEWLNPSNTLSAQTYMVLFIILFIQFRPRGLVALTHPADPPGSSGPRTACSGRS